MLYCNCKLPAALGGGSPLAPTSSCPVRKAQANAKQRLQTRKATMSWVIPGCDPGLPFALFAVDGLVVRRLGNLQALFVIVPDMIYGYTLAARTVNIRDGATAHRRVERDAMAHNRLLQRCSLVRRWWYFALHDCIIGERR